MAGSKTWPTPAEIGTLPPDEVKSAIIDAVSVAVNRENMNWGDMLTVSMAYSALYNLVRDKERN